MHQVRIKLWTEDYKHENKVNQVRKLTWIVIPYIRYIFKASWCILMYLTAPSGNSVAGLHSCCSSACKDCGTNEKENESSSFHVRMRWNTLITMSILNVLTLVCLNCFTGKCATRTSLKWSADHIPFRSLWIGPSLVSMRLM